jgi:repressor LexA
MSNRVGQIVRQKRAELGLTLAELADRAGATKGYLSMLENDKLANPPSEPLLVELEKALQIAAGALVSAARWQNAPDEVRAQAQAGAELARVLRDHTRRRKDGAKSLDDPALRRELSRLIQATLDTPSSSLDSGTGSGGASKSSSRIEPLSIGPTAALRGKVPLINKIAAGYPRDFTDLGYPARVADEYVWAPPDVEDPDAFAATVVGESMQPEYREGDVVIFSPRAKVTDGCDCFVRLEPDHESTFKRIFFDDKKGRIIRLQPLNNRFPSRTVDREQVAGLYRAVARMQKLG